jgi:hypothetical protein
MQASIRPLLLLAIVSLVTAAPPRLEVPKDPWEPIFFASINALSKKANWKPLRDLDLGADAFELRVWLGFGLAPLQGKRIRRVGKEWTGYVVIDESGDKKLTYNHEFPLGPEWENEWKKIKELGILKLPDSSTLPDEVGVLDGVSYVVEFNDGSHYRTYMYGNPQFQKWPEAKKAIEIVGALSHALNGHDLAKARPKAEQAGAGQPATRPESKSEDNQKPQPKSEGRSR